MNAHEVMLSKLEESAHALMKANRWEEAANQLKQLLALQPDWEHGYGWYNLSECYEEMGRLSDARTANLRAMDFSPFDVLLVGGMADLLYLHGDALEALDMHVRLLEIYRLHGDVFGAERTMLSLDDLATRVGWTQEQLRSFISERMWIKDDDHGIGSS